MQHPLDNKLKQQTPYNPYQAPNALLQEDVDLVEYEYAGFWIRLGAHLIDGILFFLVVSAPLMVIGHVTGISPWDSTDISVIDIISNVLAWVISIFCWIRYAGTPGKRLLKLKILDADTGEPLTMGKAIIRYLGYFVSAVVLLLGYIWVAFDQRKQGWHDKMANSVVVKEL
ncbi:MAG: RDD family protein [Moraxella sp.]|nr:RDD family protein [Moraxella sp.]